METRTDTRATFDVAPPADNDHCETTNTPNASNSASVFSLEHKDSYQNKRTVAGTFQVSFFQVEVSHITGIPELHLHRMLSVHGVEE